MTCHFPLLRSETSLTQAPQAKVTRKIVFESRLDSVAVGLLYSGDVRRDKTLFKDHDNVVVLVAGLCRAIALTRSEKTSSRSWISNPHLSGCSRADLYVLIVAGFLLPAAGAKIRFCGPSTDFHFGSTDRNYDRQKSNIF